MDSESGRDRGPGVSGDTGDEDQWPTYWPTYQWVFDPTWKARGRKWEEIPFPDVGTIPV